MQKVERDHPPYALEPNLGEGVGKVMQPTENAQEFEHSPGNKRAALLALAERLRGDFPRVSDILEALCISGTDGLVAGLYTRLAAFPQSLEPLANDNLAFPVCAHCGETLDFSVVTSPGPQYHGRCLREAYRLAATDFSDPESFG